MRRRSRVRSLRMRIAASIFTISTGLLITMSVAVYVLFDRQLLVSLDDTLRLRADSTSMQIDAAASPLRLPTGVESGAELLAGEAVLRLYDADGVMLGDASPGNPASEEERAAVANVLARGRSVHRTLALEDDEDYRILFDPVHSNGVVIGVLANGIEISRVSQPLASLRIILIIADALTAAALAWGSYWVARRALAPVMAMTETAERITHGDLHERVGVGVEDSELGRLASTFNAMIARLADTIERERRFTGDASHELRTPLAAIGVGIDVTLANEREPAEYQRVLRMVRGQTTRLNTLTDHLLLLARLDDEQIRGRFTPVALGELVAATAQEFQARNREATIQVELPAEPISILGEGELLGRALINLLDNATRHAGKSVHIDVGLARTAEGFADITVQDDGPGITDELARDVFQRFRRGDLARGEGGTGLGLAIVDAIARAHGGSVALTPARSGHGARFVLSLPSAEAMDE